MSPHVSSCSPAVPGASRSPQCHGAGSGCQRCQRPWQGAELGRMGISHQPVSLGGSGTPHIPVLSHPSATCTHRAAKGGLQVALMSLHAPLCPCHHPRLFPAPGKGSAWGTPPGMGWGCSPGPGERGRGRRELGAPGKQEPAVDAAHGPCTPSWACRGGHHCVSQLQGGVGSSATPLCPPNPAAPFTPELPSPQFFSA